MTSWHSFPTVYALGHRALSELLCDPVVVQEKVDGSQFSFGRFETPDGMLLKCRSKGAQLNIVAPDKLFSKAVEYVKSVESRLIPGWTYRAEYLVKPKHNSLSYDRVPTNHLMLFDINDVEEGYLNHSVLCSEASRLEIEPVPEIFAGRLNEIQQVRDLMDRVSVLGGQKIEGLVVKNYKRYGPDKKVLMGKFVSETFKEVHAKEWKAANPNKLDVVQTLFESLKTPARWNKAVQHLREANLLSDSPQDIGLLFKEVQADVLKEEQEWIKQQLFDWAWPHICRGITRGIPEWYKENLLALQFEKEIS